MGDKRIMSIKQMLNNKIDKWGFSVLHLSSNKKLKCKCYDSASNQGLVSCTSCFGTGYISSIKMPKVIIDSDRMRSYEQQSGFGKEDNSLVQIYTKYDTELKQRDKILVVGLNNGIPTDIKSMYVINGENEFRMLRGRTEGNGYSATRINSEIGIYQKHINALSLSAKSILRDGGTYICK